MQLVIANAIICIVGSIILLAFLTRSILAARRNPPVAIVKGGIKNVVQKEHPGKLVYKSQCGDIMVFEDWSHCQSYFSF